MAEEPTPLSNTPRRHRPRLTELAKETTEQDLWDLDDEDSLDAAPTPVAEPEAVAEPEPAAKPAPEEIPEQAESEPTPTVAEEPAAPAAKPDTAKVEEKAAAPDKTAKRTTFSDEIEPSSEPSSETAPAPISFGKPERREWIGLGILGALFLVLGIWWIAGLLTSVPTTRLGEDEPDLPISGRFMEINSAETYWRKPIREGDQPDRARADVLQIPVLSVTIEGTGDGVLRVIFRDDEGEFVGDSITHTFTAGHFDQSRSPQIEFPATSGFLEDADFNAYRVGGDRWTVEVLEGPSENAPGSEFESLLTAPISSNRR
jgi:hypothetical protein